MKGTVSVYNRIFEYDFLSGWIKYNRLSQELSLEWVSRGICSLSHLSLFENGKKTLRGEIIESILKKLKIESIPEINNIGFIRNKFSSLALQIEMFDYVAAENTYMELLQSHDILILSPYNMEYMIYTLMYRALVQRNSYEDLKNEIKSFDKVLPSLNTELTHIYLLTTGKVIYDFEDHSEGISRLESARELMDSPWVNYRLGVAYCNNAQYLKATYYLERALENYSKSGRYYNALWCHSFSGNCCLSLGLYSQAEYHYKTVLNGSDYFSSNKNIWGIYNGLASLYHSKKDYGESLKWSLKAIDSSKNTKADNNCSWTKAAWRMNDNLLLGVCNYIISALKLGLIDQCTQMFSEYLTPEYSQSRFYNYLRFLYLRTYKHTDPIFYDEVSGSILPYYEKIGYMDIQKKIKLSLIDHLEGKRRYKEATRLCKEMLLAE